ncbi:MAG: ACP S-malonyltransferase [Gammaproteobacteria bacterium]
MTNQTTDNTLAFVFPGQGSQSLGMMRALADEFDAVAARFGSASEVLGFDLWQLVCAGPEEELNATRNTQPALLAASVATWDIWRQLGGPLPVMMAGHSFGEYTALVCAGALDYATAVGLVADRGRFMQEAVPAGEGGMAAILGLDLESIEALCVQAAAGGGTCEPANLNAPGQIVVAGSAAAVESACSAALEAGAKRAMPLAVSAPAHCALMAPAAERLGARLAEIELTVPAITVVHNLDVSPHADADAIRTALVGQMTSPVRWIETVEHFASQGVTRLVECGPGKVLSALVRRIDRSLACTPLGDGDAVRACINEITGGQS